MTLEQYQSAPVESSTTPQLDEDEDVYMRIEKLAAQLDEMDAMDPSAWPEGSTDYYQTMRRVSQEIEALQAPLEEEDRRHKEEKHRKTMGGSGIRFFLSNR